MTTPGFYVTVELSAKADQDLQSVRKALLRLCRESAKEPGCTLFQLHVDRSDPRRFVLWEGFKSQDDFDLHNTLPHAKQFTSAGLIESVRAVRTEIVTD